MAAEIALIRMWTKPLSRALIFICISGSGFWHGQTYFFPIDLRHLAKISSAFCLGTSVNFQGSCSQPSVHFELRSADLPRASSLVMFGPRIQPLVFQLHPATPLRIGPCTLQTNFASTMLGRALEGKQGSHPDSARALYVWTCECRVQVGSFMDAKAFRFFPSQGCSVTAAYNPVRVVFKFHFHSPLMSLSLT